MYAVGYLARDRAWTCRGSRRYYALTPLFVGAMMMVAVANNLGVMWAAIELTTLASVFLVTFYGNVTSLEAAWKYAMIGGVGLSMALFGTIVTYYAGHKLPGADGLAGLNWSVLAQQAALLDKTSMRLAFVLVLLGYGTKAGLAPMHTWKPDAYSEAPAPAAAILSSAHAELRDLRAGPLLCADQPLPRRRITRATCCCCSVSPPSPSRSRSCSCRRICAACSHTRPSIRPESWSPLSGSAGRRPRWR